MTWLKGTSTLGAIAPLLTQLACGEVADGVGNTCAGGDQWVRENVGRDTMRTPAALDVASGNWAMRTGYFSLVEVPNTPTNTYGNNAANNLPATASVCRVSSPYTTAPGGTTHRWLVAVQVATANTTPGDYSTARLSWAAMDLDTSTSTQLTNGSALAPTSGGVATLSNGLAVTVSDPSGTLTFGTFWARAFSPTYFYGIDYWPMWARRGSGVTAPTWGTAPPGTAGTDYDILDQVTIGAVSFANVGGWVWTGAGFPDARGYCSGLGIKTATGLGTGTRYVGSFPIALLKARIYASATLGQFSIDPGPSVLDAVNGSVIRQSGCVAQANWLRCIQTPASATTSTAVQYWMSVKPTGIYVVLNADPAGTGKLGTAYIGSFTPNDATYDVLPVMTNNTPLDYTADQTGVPSIMLTPLLYWFVRRMQDGTENAKVGTATASSTTTLTDANSTRTLNQDAGLLITAGSSTAVVVSNTAGAGTVWTVASWTGGTPSSTAAYTIGRDWQTRWMRTDFINQNAQSFTLASAPIGLQVVGVSGDQGTDGYSSIPTSQLKPTFDGNWWFYGWEFMESGPGPNVGISPIEQVMIRGYQNTRYLALPGVGWGNGDELTDPNTGTKYFCLMPDYAGAAHRVRYAANTFAGGVAVVEL